MVLLALLIGCTVTDTEESNPEKEVEEEVSINNMEKEQEEETTMQLTNDEVNRTEKRNEDEMNREIIPKTREEFTELKERIQNLAKNKKYSEFIALFDENEDEIDVEYIVRSSEYTPAADDIDFRRIERFVLYYNVNDAGFGLVIDKRYGRVYYSPHFATVWYLLSDMFFAEYKEQDLDRLKKALEESGIRDWEAIYKQDSSIVTLPVAWRIGILFDDGTIMRRIGDGLFARPDGGELETFLDYVKAMGAEIERRHYAEGGEKPRFNYRTDNNKN
jgi:hypothetical protein